ncbi:MAG: response regulator [Bacteroidia bacterium]
MALKTIMIIDDDEDDRFFFCSAVKEINPAYICQEAKNGKEALEILRDTVKLPDFIFLDINMPVMGGKECLAELKMDDKLKHIPVIMYTTSSFQTDIEFTRQLGAADYFIKSFDISKLPAGIVKAMQMDVKTAFK